MFRVWIGEERKSDKELDELEKEIMEITDGKMLSNNEKEKIFGFEWWDEILTTYTSERIIDEIKTYMKNLKDNANVKRGDIVIHKNGKKGIVIGLPNNERNSIKVLYADCMVFGHSAGEFVRTGEHVDISEIFKKLEEE